MLLPFKPEIQATALEYKDLTEGIITRLGELEEFMSKPKFAELFEFYNQCQAQGYGITLPATSINECDDEIDVYGSFEEFKQALGEGDI